MAVHYFFTIAAGRNADEAFEKMRKQSQEAAQSAAVEHSVADKTEYVLVDIDWKELKQRLNYTIKELMLWRKDIQETSSDLWHRSKADKIASDLHLKNVFLEVDTEYKSHVLRAISAEAKRLRNIRNNCKRSMYPMSIAGVLLDVFNYDYCRVDGPAGCMDLTPNRKGIRKNKQFLFFGVIEES